MALKAFQSFIEFGSLGLAGLPQMNHVRTAGPHLHWLRSLNQTLGMLHHRILRAMGRKLRIRDTAICPESSSAHIPSVEVETEDKKLKRFEWDWGLAEGEESMEVDGPGPLGVTFAVFASVDCPSDMFELLDRLLQENLLEMQNAHLKKLKLVVRQKRKTTISYWISQAEFLENALIRAGIEKEYLLQFTNKHGSHFVSIVDKNHKCLIRFTESSIAGMSAKMGALRLKLYAQRV